MRRWIVAVSGLVLVGSACGGNNDGTAAGGAHESPIAEFLGEPDLSEQDVAEAFFIAEERERQDVIAACMREQGFEYIPIDPEQAGFFGVPDEEFERDSDEWVAKYGFGITTQQYSQGQVGPELIGHRSVGFVEEESYDPNQAIVEALPDAENEAWFIALYGEPEDPPEFDESLSGEQQQELVNDVDYEPTGCEGKAYSDFDSTLGFENEFGSELDGLLQRVEDDPRLVEAGRELSDCVAEQGFEFSTEDELYARWEGELSAVDDEIEAGLAEVDESVLDEMTEEELQVFFAEPELSAEAKVALGELQQQELALAKAVNDCGGLPRQSELFQEIKVELEQDFLDDNEDRLVEFKADGEG